MPLVGRKDKYEHASKMLQQKKKRLISSFIKGREPDFLKQHARILDDYLRESFEESMVGLRMGINKNPYAIIALGGYGREEQCIHSDVDLLFLFEKSVPGETEELIREVVYPLWDIGLDIGHATRSIKECISLSAQDFEVLTSLMDARFICGMSLLYSKLMEQIRDKAIRKRSNKIIQWLVESNRERHQRHGDSTYLLEPNLKEGQGGLRDYHTMLWIAKINSGLVQPRDLEFFGYLSHDEFSALTQALSFIWNVRNRLHYMVERKCDQLHFECQTQLAKTLKFREKNGQQPVEIFLGKLHGQMEFVKQQHLMFLYEQGYVTKRKRKRTPQKETKFDGLEIIRDRLCFSSPEKILNSPELLMKIFEESARLKLPLSAEANRIVGEFAYLVDNKFASCPSVVRSFERILIASAPTFNVLNEMLRTGFLERFIPEFKSIVNRIQYDEYHIFPVDKHTLHTVQTIKKYGVAENVTKDRSGDQPGNRLCCDLYKEIKNRKLLLWAALLHDIGKGEPGGGHSKRGAAIASGVLTKKGYKLKDVETVSFLIAEHLFLIKTATRRDLYDEETAIFCARKIRDVDRLKMLYLLTVADSISTGPKAWNNWTLSLLRGLFFKVLSVLEKGELASVAAIEAVEKKKEKVLSLVSASQSRQDLEALFSVMSPRYRLYTETQDILEHIKLFKSMGSLDFVWKVIKASDSNTRIVTVCAKNSPGLFFRIAGIFTLNNLDILDAQAYTWRNNIALDIFKVRPPPDQIFEDEKWSLAKENLASALSGELDLSAELGEKAHDYRSCKPRTSKRPHRIVVDNNGSSFFTIVEVFTYDFPGLLFKITDVLFRCGVDIVVAKIATKIDQVVDVFYVRDFDGQKVDSPEHAEEIKKAIGKVLEDIDLKTG